MDSVLGTVVDVVGQVLQGERLQLVQSFLSLSVVGDRLQFSSETDETLQLVVEHAFDYVLDRSLLVEDLNHLQELLVLPLKSDFLSL